MTHFLFIISNNHENIKRTSDFFPPLISQTQVIDDESIKIIFGDFNDVNYELSKKEKVYNFYPNKLKNMNLDGETENSLENGYSYQQNVKIDFEQGKITITTDPLGLDFVYFATINDKIYISSHMRYILLNEKDLLKHLDYDAMLEYVFSHCILGMKTFFKKIKLLPYNRTIELDINKIDEHDIEGQIIKNSRVEMNFPSEYETFDNKSYKNKIEEQSKLFKEYFLKLFAGHKNNNYFLLSGGLDSRTLVSSIDDQFKKESRAITFDYSNSGQNVVFAKKVAKKLKIEHIAKIISIEDTIKDAIEHMWYCEGVSTHIASRLISMLEEIKTTKNVFVDGYLGDGQFGGEFFTCIKDKHLKKQPHIALLKAMQLHNYFLPTKIFEKVVKTNKVIERSLIPELKKHTDLLWPVNDNRLRVECLLALTRGRKYTIGGPKTVEAYGITVLPFYHPQIFKSYIKLPYTLREKRKFELDVLKFLNPDIADLPTTSSKFKRRKTVQLALRMVRWVERHLGISLIPKSYAPIYKWTDKESSYYKFVNQILEDENSFIWNIVKKEEIRKLYADLFNKKSHLELFLSAFIDLEIMMKLFYGIYMPDIVVIESDNLDIKLEIEPKFQTYDIRNEIYGETKTKTN